MTFDFQVVTAGSIYLLRPANEEARLYCVEFMPRGSHEWGAGYIIEFRHLRSLVNVLKSLGFKIIHGNRRVS